jgi:hypothetical protein
MELKFNLLVASEGGETWLSSGVDADELAERIARGKAGNNTLKDRTDLAALKSVNASTVAILSVRIARSFAMGWFSSMAQMREVGKSPEDQLLGMVSKIDGVFNGLPSKGRAPITVTAGAADKQFKVELKVSKTALEEITALRALTARPRAQASGPDTQDAPPPPAPKR